MGLALTDPITLAGRTAPARVLFGPHETNLGSGRVFTRRHTAYYERRARGGAGVVVTEVASIHPLDRPYERAPLAAGAGAGDGWAEIVAACRPHRTLVLAGLGHSGLQGSSAWTRAPLWAPSRVPDPATRELPMEMGTGEIDAVIEGFRRAAALAVAADLDGVELDAGPTALLRQFLSGLTNHRADRHGLDRLSVIREVISAVRAELGPDRILALRLSCDETAPWAGITPEQAVRHVRELAASLDLLTVVRGGLFSAETYRPDAHTRPGFNRELCRAIRESVAGVVPVVLQGSVVDPAYAQHALDDEICDMVEMTRAQIADPDLVTAVREDRSPRPCVRCNQACLVRDFHNPIVGCIGNAEAGREVEPPTPAPGSVREVMVVGGGPAGLEAARVLAERGHRVTVAERDNSVGGMLRTVAAGAGRAPFAQLADWLERRCRDLNVRIRTGTTVTGDEIDAARHAGESVILATGSSPRPPGFPVDDTARYLTAVQALAGPGAVGERVVVWDPVGGPSAVAVAEHLAALGRTVIYASVDPIPGSRLSPTGDLVGANVRLQRAGITRHLGVTVCAVDATGVHLAHRITGVPVTVAGAMLVDCSVGLPDDRLQRPGLDGIGDCIAPRTVREAVREGHLLGSKL
ncbi:mycofactocin system FadH/OYE family oxidoreductase 1 [Rhodococcus chondri]|uniref:Mycofactocin system FadH/OYE family oxidoreductase 1 n=1 Tax=Rhodococcus chondri TaxID=3065941 RepID=A0ABU7JP69_9NOCA|nr:mycofactocin system FadH/OYE family oxidoreductase 1 [Rhodococcus sp. CC-R104]MEE2031823.1 mycofactocin system FadH/OYE family oxidoreductase 1 [Rhodococcus sp. CC-R104]